MEWIKVRKYLEQTKTKSQNCSQHLSKLWQGFSERKAEETILKRVSSPGGGSQEHQSVHKPAQISGTWITEWCKRGQPVGYRPDKRQSLRCTWTHSRSSEVRSVGRSDGISEFTAQWVKSFLHREHAVYLQLRAQTRPRHKLILVLPLGFCGHIWERRETVREEDWSHDQRRLHASQTWDIKQCRHYFLTNSRTRSTQLQQKKLQLIF